MTKNCTGRSKAKSTARTKKPPQYHALLDDKKIDVIYGSVGNGEPENNNAACETPLFDVLTLIDAVTERLPADGYCNLFVLNLCLF